MKGNFKVLTPKRRLTNFKKLLKRYNLELMIIGSITVFSVIYLVR